MFHRCLLISTGCACQTPVSTHGSLKIDLGTEACDFPITSWHVPCEDIRFWLHLRQWERLILLRPSSGLHTSLLQWSGGWPPFLRPQGTFHWTSLTMPKVIVPGECGLGMLSQILSLQKKHHSVLKHYFTCNEPVLSWLYCNAGMFKDRLIQVKVHIQSF